MAGTCDAVAQGDGIAAVESQRGIVSEVDGAGIDTEGTCAASVADEQGACVDVDRSDVVVGAAQKQSAHTGFGQCLGRTPVAGAAGMDQAWRTAGTCGYLKTQSCTPSVAIQIDVAVKVVGIAACGDKGVAVGTPVHEIGKDVQCVAASGAECPHHVV